MPASVTGKPHVDEDVDDLDDILDEFTPQEAPKPAPVPSTSTSTAAKASISAPPAVADDFNAEFADEFAKQMEAALREMGGDLGGVPSSSDGSAGEDGQNEALRKAWEKILVDGMNGVGEDQSAAESGPEDPFQKNIREAMERLKKSDETLQSSAASDGDDLQKLLESFGDAGADDDLHGILEGMMGQLMSKDVLYEPLKELHDKFPEYMKDNEKKLKNSDKTRYESQIVTIAKILTVFEDPTYSDEDSQKSTEIVSLMSEMQALGSPPEELMGPLPPGLGLGTDGTPSIPDECKIA